MVSVATVSPQPFRRLLEPEACSALPGRVPKANNTSGSSERLSFREKYCQLYRHGYDLDPVLSIQALNAFQRRQHSNTKNSCFFKVWVGHVSSVVAVTYTSLVDTMPEPLSLSEALDRREAKLKDDLAANPAISSNQTPSAPIYPGYHANGRSKGKHRLFVEKDKHGAHNSSISRLGGDDKRESEMEVDEQANEVLSYPPSRSSSGRVIKASRAVREGMEDNVNISPTVVNGSVNSHLPEGAWLASASPPRIIAAQRPPYEFPFPPPPWPGHYTGPASGFLQDPSQAWSCVKQNPGRTIYSQQPRPENTYR